MEILKAALRWMDGKKTYLGTIALGILGLFWSMGWLDDAQAEALGSLLFVFTGVSARAAVTKAQRAAEQK